MRRNLIHSLSPLLCSGERLLTIHSLSPLPCFVIQRKGRWECDTQRGSERMWCRERVGENVIQREGHKKQKEPHTRILRRYYHVLTVRISGEPPAFRGKPRFCEKDTVKRRKEKERLFTMMRFANLRENRDNGKRLGSRITHRLKFPSYYPPGRHHSNTFAI